MLQNAEQIVYLETASQNNGSIQTCSLKISLCKLKTMNDLCLPKYFPFLKPSMVQQTKIWEADWTHLVQNGLPLFTVTDSWELHVSHFLHLLIHINLLLQLLYLGTQEAHSVLAVVLPGHCRGTCWVDGSYPVLQLCLSWRLIPDTPKTGDRYTITLVKAYKPTGRLLKICAYNCNQHRSV